MPFGVVGGVGRRMGVLDGVEMVKIKNHGLGQYGAEPHYSTLPFWQLCALKG